VHLDIDDHLTGGRSIVVELRKPQPHTNLFIARPCEAERLRPVADGARDVRGALTDAPVDQPQ